MRRLRLGLAVAAALAVVPAQAQAVVGGTNATKGQYPSAAYVDIGHAFLCTGTLIAPQWVITAGHCGSITGGAEVGTPIAFPPQAIFVTLDGVKADQADGEKVTVDALHIPPDYLATAGYDITLLHLAAPAKATPTPIAGKGYEALWKPNALEQIVGFGTTKADGDTPDTLQQAKVPIIPDATCAAAYPTGPTDGFEAMTQICAAYPEGGVDTCQGDSGGPMYNRTGAGRLLLVGATSYGQGCADPKFPGVYARVADTTLREGFIKATAPEGILDAAPGAVVSPLETYDPATKSTTPVAPVTFGGSAGGTSTATTATTTAPTAPVAGASAPTPSPAPGPGAAPGPAAAPATAATAAGFRAALAVDRTLRKTVRTRGLRYRLRCSAACTASVRLLVDAATARRLGLASRVVGSSAFARTAAGRSTMTVRPKSALGKRVLAAKGAALSVVATVRPTSGGNPAVVSARAPLSGR